MAGLGMWLGMTSGADAAYVRVVDRQLPGYPEPVHAHDVVYDGEGAEANNVVVTGTRASVGFFDPGKTLHTNPVPPLVFDGNGNPRAIWACATPGTSTAVCAATPGSVCHSLNCDAPRPRTLDGLLKVAGNNGNDRIVVLTNGFEGREWGVYGDDVIEVANHSVDRVDCGPGADRVVADANDFVAANCEEVLRGQ